MNRRFKISILANFVANDISESLEYWLDELGITAETNYAPFDRVIQTLLDPADAITNNDFNIVLVQLERWLPSHRSTPENLTRNINDFTAAVRRVAQRTDRAAFIVILCPHSPALKDDPSILESEATLSRTLTLVPGVDVVNTSELLRLYPADDYLSYFDSFTNRIGQVPYARLGFTILGTMVARRIHALVSRSRKVIAVDCDNTIWTGLCGEGLGAVAITPDRKLIQNFLIKQSDCGRLVCLTSKNHERDVLGVFDSHPEMLLKREHLTAWKINWSRKSDNVRALSDELGLSVDSFLFLDDDPLECAEMRAVLPQVLTFLLPGAHSEIDLFLRSTWDFDFKDLTDEDRKRALYYRQDSEREKARQRGKSLREFLDSLELTVEIAGLCNEDLKRAAQLTQRTSQFNLNSIVRPAAELQALVNGGGRECVTVRARDRFGEYGLVGLLIFHFHDTSLAIETLLLSCRALGRGIEELMVVWLAQVAHSASMAHLAFDYRQTERNQPLRTFLTDLGISPAEPSCSIPVDRCFERLVPGLTPCRLSTHRTKYSTSGHYISTPEEYLR